MSVCALCEGVFVVLWVEWFRGSAPAVIYMFRAYASMTLLCFFQVRLPIIRHVGFENQAHRMDGPRWKEDL